jgi:RNA polymerase sigma factor (TIGR02999 family)
MASDAVRGGRPVRDTDDSPITTMLGRWRAGDAAASAALMPLIYDQLRAIARRQLASERAARTLLPTDLVHEAYLKLFTGTPPDASNRLHFFAIAATAMREVLVDHERRRRARKRDGGERVTLTGLDVPNPSRETDLIELDEALDALAKIDARKARVIELRAFAGLEFAEIAELLGISRATLARDFRAARAWLYAALDLPLGNEAAS